MAVSERQRAVVIGASMAGLLAARVLSDHFSEVEIIDRDRLPDGPEFRNGVPQSRHAHALLRAGLDVLDRLFPGFSTDLEDAGAVPMEPPRDLPWLNAAGWSGRFGAGMVVLASSRELTECLVRRRLQAIPNVTFRTRSEVIGLIAANGRVSGLSIRARDGSRPDSSQATTLDSDFVVDASGRMSKVSEWLEQIGFERPREVVVNSHLGYASRIYHRPRQFDWKGLLIRSMRPVTSSSSATFEPQSSSRLCETPSPSGKSMDTREQKMCAATTSCCRGGRTGSLSSVTRPAASTRSMGRA